MTYHRERCVEKPWQCKVLLLNYQGHYGYLDYDEETHEMTVFIPDAEEAAQKVRDFLSSPKTMEVPTDQCTYHFGEVTVDPQKSWQDCQQAPDPAVGQYRCAGGMEYAAPDDQRFVSYAQSYPLMNIPPVDIVDKSGNGRN